MINLISKFSEVLSSEDLDFGNMKNCIIFLLLILFSCNTRKLELTTRKIITAEKQILDTFPLSSIGVKGLDYLILNTGEDYLIGQINKVILFPGYVFALDEEYSESIYAFDELGELLFVLSAQADGPDGITEISDFTVDTKRQELLVLNSSKKQVIRISFQGKILSRFEFDAFFQFIAYHEEIDRIILARVEAQIPKDPYNNAQVIVLDEKGKLEAKHLPAQEEDAFLTHWFPLRPLVEGNGKVYYAKNFMYKLWEIGVSTNEAYYFDYGNRSIESLYPIFNKNPEGIRKELQNKEDYLRFLPLFLPLPNEKWLIILEGRNNQLVWHYIDNSSEENYLFKYLLDDIEQGLMGLPVGASNDGFYYTLVPEILFDTFQNDSEKIPKRLRDILESKDYNGDYQVLVKAKF